MKRFLGLLAGVAMLGSLIAIGCSGGTPASGNTDTSAISALPTPSRAMTAPQIAADAAPAASNAPTTARGQNGAQALAQIQARLDAGQITAEQAATLREQVQQRGQGGQGGQARQGRGGASGTLAAINGSTLTITAQRGDVKAAVTKDTVISISSTSSASALKLGTSVVVNGSRDAGNVYIATSFIEIPADGGPLGGAAQRFLGQGTPGPQQTTPLQGQVQPAPAAGGFFLGQDGGGQFGGQGGNAAARQQFLQQLQQQQVAQGTTPVQANRLMGTVEKIEGTVVTINTAQGPLRVTVTPETFIQSTRTGTVADLKVGMQLTVNGQAGADGTVQATAVLVGQQGFVGLGGAGGFGGQGGLRGQGGGGQGATVPQAAPR